MYQDAVAQCRAVWKAIDTARKAGCQIYVEIHPDRVIVQSLKSMQRVWIDAASTVDYSGWVPSTVPSEGEIDPDSGGSPMQIHFGQASTVPTVDTD
jgi:hypothetical protein